MSEVRVYDAPSDLVGRWVRETDMQALRAENARLRGVIAELVEACDAAGKSGHHVAVGIRVTLGNAKAALQPERGKP